MQYVRSLGGTVGAAWNSINPATLSGAIDVIVVEQEDGSLACSPFHIRFGKFSLLRPYEKKVEFQVNGKKLDFPMKLGEGGEAFFVFGTQESVPDSLQTSPLATPTQSPDLRPSTPNIPALQEPDVFDLEGQKTGRPHSKSTSTALPLIPSLQKAHSDSGAGAPLLSQPEGVSNTRPASGEFSRFAGILERTSSEADTTAKIEAVSGGRSLLQQPAHALKSTSPSSAQLDDAKARAMNLSRKLWTSNISNQVTESGDLMLDMTGYKSSDGEALHAEIIARQLLTEEMDGPYDIGALIGADEKGNIWIYSSEEAKEAADQKASRNALGSYNPSGFASTDAISDPGYHSDDNNSQGKVDFAGSHARRDSDSAVGFQSQPSSPTQQIGSGDPNKNYAKTLRLTSDQLKSIELKRGANKMSFTVNRATCQANLWFWRHDSPIVISDIDGTITKSDVLGHALNFIGRDWTHLGVAKLYTDIASNGYNFLYLTSRSVGQADTTRNYLDGVVQEGYRLPKGPVILSPDRTIAALRREVYLRKPEIFKMACLRDIMALFTGHGGANNTTESAEAGLHAHIPGLGTSKGKGGSPFYAGFGNRLTDALSYRSVNIPSTRIFTINSNSEVSLDLLSLNKYKTAYSTMREIVDHYFPPVDLLVTGGGEEFTDYNYWRDKPLDIVDFTDSESEDGAADVIEQAIARHQVSRSSPTRRLSGDEIAEEMMDSYISEDARPSVYASVAQSVDDDDYDEDEDDDFESTADYEDEEDEDEGEDGEDYEEEVFEEGEDDYGSVGSAPVTPNRELARNPLEEGDATPRR